MPRGDIWLCVTLLRRLGSTEPKHLSFNTRGTLTARRSGIRLLCCGNERMPC